MNNFEAILYLNCRTFDDLKAMTIGMLTGVTKDTFDFFGPIEEETRPLLENIVTLNFYPFLTSNSQPNKYDDDERQKAYVSGYMPRDLVPPFIEFMRTREPFFYEIIDASGKSKYNVPFESGLDMRKNRVDLYPMTIQKKTASSPWTNFTVIKNRPEVTSGMVFGSHEEKFNPGMRDMFKTMLVYVTVVCRYWNSLNDPVQLLIYFFSIHLKVKPVPPLGKVSNVIALLLKMQRKGFTDAELDEIKGVVVSVDNKSYMSVPTGKKIMDLGFQEPVMSMLSLLFWQHVLALLTRLTDPL